VKFAKLLGSCLVKIERQVFQTDFEFYDPSCRDEESDGPIQFTTDCGIVFWIAANTELMSVDSYLGVMLKYGSTYSWRDVGANSFWNTRVGRQITDVWALFSNRQKDVASPFGLEFCFQGAAPFVVEYLSNENHLDQIRIGSTWSELPVSDVRRVRMP
jgi:hypothetical protein